MSVPDEGYSRNALCALNMKSTFLLHEYLSLLPLLISIPSVEYTKPRKTSSCD